MSSWNWIWYSRTYQVLLFRLKFIIDWSWSPLSLQLVVLHHVLKGIATLSFTTIDKCSFLTVHVSLLLLIRHLSNEEWIVILLGGWGWVGQWLCDHCTRLLRVWTVLFIKHQMKCMGVICLTRRKKAQTLMVVDFLFCTNCLDNDSTST